MSDEKTDARTINSVSDQILELIISDRPDQLENCLRQIKDESLLSETLSKCLDEAASEISGIDLEETLDAILEFAARNMSKEGVCKIMKIGFFSQDEFTWSDCQEKLKKYANSPERNKIVCEAIQTFKNFSVQDIQDLYAEDSDNDNNTENEGGGEEENDEEEEDNRNLESKRYQKDSTSDSDSEVEDYKSDVAKKESPSELDNLIENIKKEIDSSNWTKDEINLSVIKEILCFIALVRASIISHQTCLTKIMQLAEKGFQKGQRKEGTSDSIAWFFFHHLNLKRIKFYYEAKPSGEAHRLLALSKAACAEANIRVNKGGNTDLKGLFTPASEERKKAADGVKKNRAEVKAKAQVMMPDNDKKWSVADRIGLKMALRAQFAEESHIGNCNEKSDVALKILIQAGVTQAEIFKIDGFDHILIVIGRKPDSDPSDYTTWGEDAVICDPWMKDAYFAFEIPQRSQINPCHHTLLFKDQMNVATMKSGLKFLQEAKQFSDVSCQLEKKEKPVSLSFRHNFYYKPPGNRPNDMPNISPTEGRIEVSTQQMPRRLSV